MENTTNETSSRWSDRSLKELFGIMLRGFAMGAAEVIPGVSGGTLAFILGIYEELVESIKVAASKDLIQAVLKFRIKEILNIVNWKFLIALALGMLLAIGSLANFLEYLFKTVPVYLWSFFFGLIVASVFVVSKRIKQWSAALAIAVTVGTFGAYLLVGLIPAETPDVWWFYILSGVLASYALILPGLSGSFVLVLLGKYQDVLSAVPPDGDIPTLILVAFGVGIGLVTFSQVVSYLFKNYPDMTVAVLMGLMIGSLRKIWPWKEVLETTIDRHGEVVPLVEKNIAPMFTINGVFNTEIIIALAMAVVALVVVIAIDRMGSHEENEAHS